MSHPPVETPHWPLSGCILCGARAPLNPTTVQTRRRTRHWALYYTNYCPGRIHGYPGHGHGLCHSLAAKVRLLLWPGEPFEMPRPAIAGSATWIPSVTASPQEADRVLPSATTCGWCPSCQPRSKRVGNEPIICTNIEEFRVVTLVPNPFRVVTPVRACLYC